MRHHGAKELRRDFQMSIGLELVVVARPNLMQHENGTNARENRPQQTMGAAEVKRFQPGADGDGTKLAHLERSAFDAVLRCCGEASGGALKKRLVGRSSLISLFRVISSLTASQGFVFSRFPDHRTANARTFQVE